MRDYGFTLDEVRPAMHVAVKRLVLGGDLPADAARETFDMFGLHGQDRQVWVDEVEALYATPLTERSLGADGAGSSDGVPRRMRRIAG